MTNECIPLYLCHVPEDRSHSANNMIFVELSAACSVQVYPN